MHNGYYYMWGIERYITKIVKILLSVVGFS